jgi:hypothetical protein
MKERLDQAEFLERIQRIVIGEYYLSRSPLSFQKIATLIRCTNANINTRLKDDRIIAALNKNQIFIDKVNNLNSLIYQPKNQ